MHLTSLLGAPASLSVSLTVVLFAAGILLIVKGGDWFVDAASWFAEISGIPKLIVGATVVSLATTLPELLVSVFAAAEGSVDMAIGNAVGSVTANIGLIMAIALLCIPTVIRRKDYLLKSVLMLLACGVLTVLGAAGNSAVGFVPSILLLLIFAVSTADNVKTAVIDAKKNTEARVVVNSRREIVGNILKFLVGAAAVVAGADLLVDNGSALAVKIGVPERIIAVTFVAVGTSLPELVTTVTAIVKKQASLSAGNIIGANIIDLTLILPLCSLVSGKPIPITGTAGFLDIPASLVVGAVALIPALISGKFRRIQGAALLALYAVYLYLTVAVFG